MRVAQDADISITKQDDVDPVRAGSDVVYTNTLNSSAPDDATNVQVTAVVSAGGLTPSRVWIP